MPDRKPLHLMMFSIHGLLRGRRPELGRDPDTGGQILYVLELARVLGEQPEVASVDLITRLIEDPDVDDDYALPVEPLGPNVSIRRIRCGPRRYIRKELLWSHLDEFVDHVIDDLRSRGAVPDLVHGHYADAGYVAARVSSLLNLPMAFTGHSLGRVKLARLLEQGTPADRIEKKYHITRRIEAEETALDHAGVVVASTQQEVEEQYAEYENYHPRRMVVIPPGVDLESFTTRGIRRSPRSNPAFARVARFLRDPKKPMVLAISRADPRKNVLRLVEAYATNDELRERANLVLVLGNRKRIDDLDPGAAEVLTDVLKLIDEYDLYGKVAYPKSHEREDISRFYRLAAETRGVFVNPALTEPFGLTLLEAAASGVPVVGTADGGPRDILARCRNGTLVDPLSCEEIGSALLDAIKDRKQWLRWSRAGVRGSKRYSWSAHAERTVKTVRKLVGKAERDRRFFAVKGRLITFDRLVVADIDNTLIGDRRGLRELIKTLRDSDAEVAFAIATGRSIALTREVLNRWKIPTPQVLITSVGSAIRYGSKLVEDYGWERHIRYRWKPERLREAMKGLPGVELQGPEGQSRYKISYDVDPEKMPPLPEIRARLRRRRLQAKLIFSHNAYLDVLPIRASKGMAVRYFCLRWGIPIENCLVAGDSGNDEEMLTGKTLGVVVGNHDPDLEKLRGHSQVYFADGHNAWGILEGIEHYDFLGEIRVPAIDPRGVTEAIVPYGGVASETRIAVSASALPDPAKS
ncbi:MAG: HAD-IIB family hydrolase [Acidobacteriota bacterium]|nr:HAD-IIB family hydrolase [Acidobacteriota bacterium]MDH3785799.1 HAD-IIB family hydrolase [Acidobacteriota bacterium]